MTSLFGENCTNDRDCAGPLLCYKADEVSWLDALGYDSSACLCNEFYGWEGEDCLDLGIGAYFTVVSSSLQGVFSLVIVIYLVWAIFHIVRKGSAEFNAAFTSAIFGVFAIFGMVVWKALTVALVLTPDKADSFSKRNGREIKTHDFLPYILGGVIVASVFAILLSLNVSLIWIQIAASSRKLSRRTVKNISGMWYYVVGLEVVWVVLALVLWILGLYTILAIVVVIPLVIVMISYAIGRYRMVNLLYDMGDFESGNANSALTMEDRKLGDLIWRIRRLTLVVIIFLSLAVATTMTYGILVQLKGEREVTPVDDGLGLHVVTVLFELISLFILIPGTFLVFFVAESLVPFSIRVSFSSKSFVPSRKTSYTGTSLVPQTQVQTETPEI